VCRQHHAPCHHAHNPTPCVIMHASPPNPHIMSTTTLSPNGCSHNHYKHPSHALPLAFAQPHPHHPTTHLQQAAAAFAVSNTELPRPQQAGTAQKHSLPAMGEAMGSNKKVCTTSAPFASRPLPCCTVCLGRNPHRTIECAAACTWDGQHEVFSEHIHKGLWSKDGKQLCTAWQREEGCTTPKHDSRHLCSGCGATTHGAQMLRSCSRVTDPKGFGLSSYAVPLSRV